MTLVAGLRLDGIGRAVRHWAQTNGAFNGSLLDGPINGDWFEACVRHVLAPTLRPGDIVIMDNLSSHERAAARDIIEAAGARVQFLPPCSPDFNPIEMAFSKLKAMLRKAAKRTVAGLWSAIGQLVDVFTPQECANYFAAAAYDADCSGNALGTRKRRASGICREDQACPGGRLKASNQPTGSSLPRMRRGAQVSRAWALLASTVRPEPQDPAAPADEERLTEDIIELARDYGRYGYRMITGMLNQSDWHINHTRRAQKLP